MMRIIAHDSWFTSDISLQDPSPLWWNNSLCCATNWQMDCLRIMMTVLETAKAWIGPMFHFGFFIVRIKIHLEKAHQWWCSKVGSITDFTLWLCQNSYWKWWFIVDLPIKNGALTCAYRVSLFAKCCRSSSRPNEAAQRRSWSTFERKCELQVMCSWNNMV